MQQLDRVMSKPQGRKAAAHAKSVKGRKAALEVQGAETRKKQKTPIKRSIRVALAGLDVDGKLVNNEGDADAQQKRMKEDSKCTESPSKSNAAPLMGPHGEAHQEQ
jgi:hypothetical protein